jgi:DNA-binding IclR family transcriptional regulator
MADKLDSDRYIIPNLSRGLKVIEYLAAHPEGLNMGEMAEGLNIAKSGIYRIVATLVKEGYIRKEDDTAKHKLTRKLLSLGQNVVCQYNITEISIPVMRELRDATGETVQLNTMTGLQGVVLEQMPSPKAVRIVVDPGTLFDLHCTAPGKAIMAFLPETERNNLLPKLELTKHSPTTITDLDDLKSEMVSVAEAGYALDRAEGVVAGLHCVSAPILDEGGYPVAALTVTAPAMRMQEKDFQAAGELIVMHARKISSAMI